VIAKRIDRQGRKSGYRACALYIGAAEEARRPGAKLWRKWYAGGETEDFQEGLLEVELTQALNTRATKSKTYHLVASFHPEDKDKLTKEVFEAIEKTLAEALGFSGHQRHCGVHIDTGHIHLHVAYNQIDPVTFNHKTPYYDFPKLSRACRELEKKYGLVADRGMENRPGENREVKPNSRVKSLEAQTGQESLLTYAGRHKKAIEAELSTARNWREAQAAFLKRGLVLKLAGNGLAVKDRFGKHSVKASDLDRAWSKGRLEKRFGPFETLDLAWLKTIEGETKYEAAPLEPGAEKAETFGRFQDEMARRRAALENIERESRCRYERWRERWGRKRREIRLLPMFKRDRQSLRLELNKRAGEELAKMRKLAKEERRAVRAEYPFINWKNFLAYQAAKKQPQVQDGRNPPKGAETAEGLPQPLPEIVKPAGKNEKPELSPGTGHARSGKQLLFFGG